MQDTTFDPQGNTVPETVVGATVNIQGDLNSDGNIRIDGNVKGTVSTKQNVQVEEKAVILASITAGSASIAGRIEGNLKISGQLVLLRTANIKGDLYCQTLRVEDGAIFNGKCSMGSQPTSTDKIEAQE